MFVSEILNQSESVRCNRVPVRMFAIVVPLAQSFIQISIYLKNRRISIAWRLFKVWSSDGRALGKKVDCPSWTERSLNGRWAASEPVQLHRVYSLAALSVWAKSSQNLWTVLVQFTACNLYRHSAPSSRLSMANSIDSEVANLIASGYYSVC